MRSLTREDVPVAIEGDGVEFRTTPIGGDHSVAFVRLPAGANLAPALKGLPEDLCQCPHWGYMIAGEVVVTHNPAVASRADRVFRLDCGRLVQQ